MGARFRHVLDLQLRLIDTSTGRAVTRGPIELFRDGKPLEYSVRDESLLLIDSGREDFELRIRAFGYEEKCLSIRYAELDVKMPSVEPHLIPNGRDGRAVYTLEGEMPGLVAIDAVRMGDTPALMREFDERKKIMKVFNPHRLEMSNVFYGIVDPNEGTYEAIEIKKRISDSEYKLSRKLEKSFGNNSPVTRLAFGRVDEKGRYLLRVRDDTREPKWLVRCTADGKEAFYPVDFKRPETLVLRAGDTGVRG